jgi:transcriptional regulator with XRE-family HTH domain
MAESATALGAFLRARRGRIGPAEAGLPDSGNRRTPGLRREEVAQLAGVSADYYTRLEQGRSSRPSPRVVAALARALMLSAAERRHLAALAGVEPAAAVPQEVRDVPPLVLRVLEAALPAPACVLDRVFDVVAWNRSAAALLADFAAYPPHRRNLVWLLLRDDAARARLADPDGAARGLVAALRAAVGAEPPQGRAAALVTDLHRTSGDFRAWWHGDGAPRPPSGSGEYRHPEVGRVRLDHQALLLPDDSGRCVVVFTARPHSPDQAAVELLASGAEGA